jgi:hypothetical protein
LPRETDSLPKVTTSGFFCFIFLLFQFWHHLKNNLWLLKTYRWLILTLQLLNWNVWEYGQGIWACKSWISYKTKIRKYWCVTGGLSTMETVPSDLLVSW